MRQPRPAYIGLLAGKFESLISGAAVGANTFVQLDGSGNVIVCTAATDFCIGIALNATTGANQAVTVQRFGRVQVDCHTKGTVAGTAVTSQAAGEVAAALTVGKPGFAMPLETVAPGANAKSHCLLFAGANIT